MCVTHCEVTHCEAECQQVLRLELSKSWGEISSLVHRIELLLLFDFEVAIREPKKLLPIVSRDVVFAGP
ncbi:MAG: hypothetical protein ACI9HK_004851 [Pirellulaceae bacterium]|jgi:hypothetical protein